MLNLYRLILFVCLFRVTVAQSQTIKFTGNLKFNAIDAIEDNFIIASLNGKRGIIDEKEIIQIPFEYDSIKRVLFRYNTCSIRKNGLWGIYNFSTKSEVVPCKYEAQIRWHNEKYIAVMKDNKWAVYNFIEKKYITNFIYDGFYYFDSLSDENPWGYGITAIKNNIFYNIDKNGNEKRIGSDERAVPVPVNDRLLDGYLSSYQSSLSGHWIVQGFNEKYGILNSEYKMIIDTLYDGIEDGPDIFKIEKNGESCFFNKNGKMLSPFSKRLDLVNSTCGLLILYREGNNLICNNIKGEPVFNKAYDDVFFEYNSKIGFAVKKTKYTFIDCNGEKIIPKTFKGIKRLSDTFLIKKNKFWQLATIN